ncbi:hypothetical protein WN943_027802 [Citrus x changshan-huyou]
MANVPVSFPSPPPASGSKSFAQVVGTSSSPPAPMLQLSKPVKWGSTPLKTHELRHLLQDVWKTEATWTLVPLTRGYFDIPASSLNLFGGKLVDAGFRFSSFYDQDLCSINVITTRGSPRKASSPEVPAHTDKSEYAGYFPGANPPTLKSDMKASSESQFSAFFETVWDSDCRVMGKRGILHVTPRFWGKRGCPGFVRSCFRFFGGRFSGWRACLANCRRPGLLASRPLAGMALCLLQEICLADDVLVDEQDISAPVPPRTRLLRNTPVRRTLPSDICSPCLVSSTYFSQTPVPQFLVLGNVVDQQ